MFDVKRADQKLFLMNFAQSGHVKRAAEEAGICRTLPYWWQKHDTAFANAFEEAREMAAGMLEDELVRRAQDGWEEPVYQGGRRVGTVRKYSDTCLIFALKNRDPGRYGNRLEVAHSATISLEGLQSAIVANPQAIRIYNEMLEALDSRANPPVLT